MNFYWGWFIVDFTKVNILLATEFSVFTVHWAQNTSRGSESLHVVRLKSKSVQIQLSKMSTFIIYLKITKENVGICWLRVGTVDLSKNLQKQLSCVENHCHLPAAISAASGLQAHLTIPTVSDSSLAATSFANMKLCTMRYPLVN